MAKLYLYKAVDINSKKGRKCNFAEEMNNAWC
jgi:hypothetical protein